MVDTVLLSIVLVYIVVVVCIATFENCISRNDNNVGNDIDEETCVGDDFSQLSICAIDDDTVQNP